MMLARQPGLAVWAQIADTLREDIASQSDDGDWLAAEPELAARFGVNRHTLRRAVDALIDEGLVERVHGRGTRVLTGALTYGIGTDTRFTEQLAASGRTASVDLLDKAEFPATGAVARRLQVAEGAAVLRMTTLRGEAGFPLALSLHFLTGAAAMVARADYEGGSLHGLLRRHGITLERKQSLITTRLPLPQDALQLRAPRNRPVLRVKGINACRECGLILEYVISQFRGDHIELSVTEPGFDPDPAPDDPPLR